MLRKIVGLSLIVIATLIAAATTSLAVPPHPDAIEQFKAQGVWEKKIAQLRVADSICIARIAERQAETDKRAASTAALSDGEVDTMRALVILVDFPDFHYDSTSYDYPGGQLNSTVAGTPAMFDSMLFTQRGIDTKYNPTGSMTEFYLETSHGKLFIMGDVYGWYEMPHNYSWYVGDDDGLTGGSILARHAATAAANDSVDFSLYANGSSQVPGFMVVHAGPGAETGAYGIWSHQGGMDVSLWLNGVLVGPYSMNPEELYNTLSSMGVFSHEWGHVLGLPDWYDVSYQGQGLGDFSLMGGGSWNNNGQSPALLDAVSRTYLNYTQAIPITQNTKNVPLAQVETGGPVYILNYSSTPPYKAEFWYVENRQKTGLFDYYLPGEGLLIYHYDSYGHQDNPARYKLAIEQADGWDQLGVPVSGHNANGGDAGDPWPGSTNNRNFWDYSIPNAHTNADGAASQIGVYDISNSDSVMYAELAVAYSKPWVVLSDDSVVMTDNAPGGDGDGILEQGETINMMVTVRNLARQSFRPRCTVSVDQPGITFLQNNVKVGVNNVALNPGQDYTTGNPIIFQIPASQWSTIATFTITVISDTVYSSNPNGTDRTYVNSMTYEEQIGSAQLLLVDDDNGRSDHSGYVDAFNTMGLLYDRWSKADSGSPTEDVLSEYSAVLWMTGSSLSGGTLTVNDVAAMKGYLDAGGNLSLASMKAASQLDVLDSAFLADYFHVSLPGGSRSANNFLGLAGHPVGDSLRYQSSNIAPIDSLTVVGSALPAFRATNVANTVQYGISGVTYEGTYRTVFLSFAIEFLKDDAQASGFSPKAELLSRLINFLTLGSHTAVDDPSEPTTLPGAFALEQNYPNPFNPSTVIQYTVNPGELTVTNLSVYNVLGRKVATLVDAVQGPGTYRVEWDGRSSDGTRAATGVYMYRLTRGDNVESKKMLLLK